MNLLRLAGQVKYIGKKKKRVVGRANKYKSRRKTSKV